MRKLIRSIINGFYRMPIKPILFAQSPDTVHTNMIKTSQFLQKIPGMIGFIRFMMRNRFQPYIEQKVFGTHFSNPIGLSAGLDKNGEIVPMLDAIGFGFATIGSVSAKSAAGNARPWFYRLPKSKSLVVNAGLPNHGAKTITKRIAAVKNRLSNDFQLIISIAKTNSPETVGDEAGTDDYIEGIKTVIKGGHTGLIELNISCPNAFGGEPFTRPEALEMLLTAVDSLKLKQPVIIKMPISLPLKDYDALLDIIVSHNIAGVTIGNLQKDRAAVALSDPLPETVKGNLSGQPTFEASNQLIRRTYEKYGDKLVVIGVGGIFSAADAYEKIKNGATLVELITGMIFNGPAMIGKIQTDLSKLVKQDGYTSISQAIGSNIKNAQTD